MRRALKRKFRQLLPERLQRALDQLAAERLRRNRDLRHLEREDRREFFRKAFFMLQFNEISGDYAEFGCWTGTTFTLAYEESRRAIGVIAGWERKATLACRLWAFDSFAGLPEPASPSDEHPRWLPGALKTTVEEFHAVLAAARVPRAAYEVVPGYYEHTLLDPARQASLPHDLQLAFVDCDLYSSTATVLRFLLPRLKHGMVIAFDDYYCDSSSQPSGERRACREVFTPDAEWRLVPYVQFGWHGMSFLVERNEGRWTVPRS